MPNMTGPLRPLQEGGAVRIGKSRSSFLSRIAQTLERNMGLRLISLVLAIGLWIFVNAGQHGALEVFQVPVSYVDLPPGYMLTNAHPDFVRVQVSGPRTLISIIDPTHLRLRLDLTGVGVGQASFKIGPDSFPVPRQTEVTGVVPSQIVLDIDKYVTRDVPIRLVLSGTPATGYKIASSEVMPATVAVRGASREVARVDQIDTEPFSVAGITTDLSRAVNLIKPATAVRLLADEATTRVTLAPVITHKEFHDVPITVRDTDLKFRLGKSHLNLILSGPLLTLEKMDLKTTAYVDAAGFDPGSYSVPVQIDLPDGITMLRQTPQKVRLRIYRELQAQTN